MLRLTLIIVLVAATASAKQVNKVRRNEDMPVNCYGPNHYFGQCRPRNCSYPVYIALEREWKPNEIKRILLADDNLENFCREWQMILNCATTAYDQSPAECKELYNTEESAEEILDNAVIYLRDICDPDVIESFRRNLDCMIEENLAKEMDTCFHPNIDKNCSGFSYNDDYSDARACWDEKFRKNCDANDVVDCVSKKVTAACNEEAGELAELFWTAKFKTLDFPICRGRGGFKTLLKYFKIK